jgi:NDP-sugar pyrophosphorylase family protein
MLERTILHLIKFGVNQIIINVHHFAEQIEEFLVSKNNFEIDIAISDERKLLLDTGGGLKNASWFFNSEENFIVINSDVITDLDLNEVLDYHYKKNALATLVIRNRKSSRCFLFDSKLDLCGWKNHKTGETKITRNNPDLKEYPFSGIHVINSIIFKHITSMGKFSIVDTYLDLSSNHMISGFVDNDSKWFDIGDLEKLKVAENALGKN